MNTKFITILSNYSYLLGGIHMFFIQKYFYGMGAIIIWYISHTYHNNTLDLFWRNLDMMVASLFLTFILINDFNKLSDYKIQILLSIILVFFLCGTMCFNRHSCNDKNHTYNIIHSIWHILSALFVLYFITL